MVLFCLNLRFDYDRDPSTIYPPTIAILDECDAIIKELRKKLHQVLKDYDMRNKMPVSAAERCSCELLGLMSYFIELCIEFQINHGQALFCKNTYQHLKTGIQRLKELRVQWAFVNFLEEGGDFVAAKRDLNLIDNDVQSVWKKKDISDQFVKTSNKKDRKKAKRQRKQKRKSASNGSTNKSKGAKCK